MPTSKIHRAHRPGLDKARKVAWARADHVEHKFGMECTVIEGRTSDAVEFTRSGVDGRLIVTSDQFDLDARRGLQLGVFAGTIESEIERELDQLPAERGGVRAPTARAGAEDGVMDALDGSANNGRKAATQCAGRISAKAVSKGSGRR